MARMAARPPAAAASRHAAGTFAATHAATASRTLSIDEPASMAMRVIGRMRASERRRETVHRHFDDRGPIVADGGAHDIGELLDLRDLDPVGTEGLGERG